MALDSVDKVVLRNLPDVGDKSIVKILGFADDRGISTLEGLSAVGGRHLPFTKLPSSLDELLEAENFEPAREKARSDLADWSSNDVEVVTLGSEHYPRQLLDLESPPPFLFCKGNLELLKKNSAVAVVGTRKNTQIGEKIAIETVETCAKHGFSIVSGLALGIDAIAHRAALEFNAPTIAVLVDLVNVSPSSNRELADEILDHNGLWIAENPPGTRMVPGLFVNRDRIQAGLSKAVFAIETSEKGGTMHAVNASLEIKRPIFVPDASAAGYPDLTIDAISGTQQRVQDKKATPYTRESCADKCIQLKESADQPESKNQQQELPF